MCISRRFTRWGVNEWTESTGTFEWRIEWINEWTNKYCTACKVLTPHHLKLLLLLRVMFKVVITQSVKDRILYTALRQCWTVCSFQTSSLISTMIIRKKGNLTVVSRCVKWSWAETTIDNESIEWIKLVTLTVQIIYVTFHFIHWSHHSITSHPDTLCSHIIHNNIE